MAKKISIKNPKLKTKSSEEWVLKREGTKRLTIDVPISLHTQLKMTSVEHGKTMGDMVKDSIYEYLKLIKP